MKGKIIISIIIYRKEYGRRHPQFVSSGIQNFDTLLRGNDALEKFYYVTQENKNNLW
jgi:hypothetical protein